MYDPDTGERKWKGNESNIVVNNCDVDNSGSTHSLPCSSPSSSSATAGVGHLEKCVNTDRCSSAEVPDRSVDTGSGANDLDQMQSLDSSGLITNASRILSDSVASSEATEADGTTSQNPFGTVNYYTGWSDKDIFFIFMHFFN